MSVAMSKMKLLCCLIFNFILIVLVSSENKNEKWPIQKLVLSNIDFEVQREEVYMLLDRIKPNLRSKFEVSFSTYNIDDIKLMKSIVKLLAYIRITSVLCRLGWHCFTKSQKPKRAMWFSHSLDPKDSKKPKFDHLEGSLVVLARAWSLWSGPQ